MQFDSTDSFQVTRQIKSISYEGLKRALNLYMVRSGLRQIEHPTEHKRRVRKSVALANGFRKHVISTFIEAGLNHEIRELLVDHATGLDASYFRPSEKQVLEEYLKAEPYLTIDSSLRLKQENDMLRISRSELEQLREEVKDIRLLEEDMKKVKVKLFGPNLDQKPNWNAARKEIDEFMEKTGFPSYD